MLTDDMQYFKGIGNEVIVAAVAGPAVFLLLLVILKYVFDGWFHQPVNRNGNDGSAESLGRSWTDWLPSWLYQPDTYSPEQLSGRNRTHFTTDTCSICIGSPRLPLETNCGHLFCGGYGSPTSEMVPRPFPDMYSSPKSVEQSPCIAVLTSHHFALRAVKCPLCRESVSIFYECFSEEERQIDSEERRAIQEMVQYYNRRFSGQHSSVWSHLRDLPTTLRHMWREVLRSDGDTAHTVFRLRIFLFLVAAILYLVSPIDLVPEAAFGALGLLDDVMVVVLLAIYLSILYRRLIVSRGGNIAVS